MFRASTEQAQEFWQAAVDAGYATRPVQIFYALSQFGRAIAAASRHLPDTEPELYNDGRPKLDGGKPKLATPWQLFGHGLEAKDLRRRAQNGITAVTVKPGKSGSFISVARALAAQAPPQEDLDLTTLWEIIPETADVPLTEPSTLPALHFSPASPMPDVVEETASLTRIPRAVIYSVAQGVVGWDEFLRHYPRAAGYGKVSGLQPAAGTAKLHWAHPEGMDREEARRTLGTRRATRYRGEGDTWLFPAIGGMTEELHPILTWWAVLLALSSLTRYEPVSWARMIDIDQSATANAIEHLLDVALDVVPHLCLLAIHDVART